MSTAQGAKPKKPFLKRGVGTQARITATQRKKYVPKGGFVLNLSDDPSPAGHQSEEQLQRQGNHAGFAATENASPGIPAGALREAVESAPAGSLKELQAYHRAGNSQEGLLQPTSKAVEISAMTKADNHWTRQKQWQQNTPQLDPEGDIWEMQSQSEMVMNGSSSSISNLTHPAIPTASLRFAAPSGCDALQAKEVCAKDGIHLR